MKILCLFAILLSVQVFAQCKDSDKILFEKKEISGTNILIFPVESSTDDGIYRDISHIIRYANDAMAGAEAYIRERSGAAFQKQCKANYIYVHYPDDIDVETTSFDLYMIPDYNITYTVVYEWQFGDFSYDFEIDLGKDYKAISEARIPSIAGNPNFYKLVDVCKALRAVNRSHTIKAPYPA